MDLVKVTIEVDKAEAAKLGLTLMNAQMAILERALKLAKLTLAAYGRMSLRILRDG